MRIDGPQITGSFSLNGDGVQDLDVFATTSSLNTYTSSTDTMMGHVLTATHSLNTFTSSAGSRMVSIESKTGSYATTGSNTFVGLQTIQGSIVPGAHATYDLGSAGYNFRHLYLSSASLYIDGTKVLGSTTQELQITTDNGQSFKILEAGSDTITLQSNDGNITLATSGGGDVILDPTTGIIALKGTTQVYSGNKIRSSDGNNIVFGDGLTVSGSVTITGFIEAQELRTTYISSSILYRSGSTKFGDELTDTHSFSGSVLISGSLSVPESNLVSGSSQITYSGLNGVPSGIVSGSSQIDVLSTTNIARLATTGSNTFSGNILISKTDTTSLQLNSTTATAYSAFFHSENGTPKAYWEYINSSFSDSTRRNYLEAYNGVGGFSVYTAGSKALDISTTGAATFSGKLTANAINGAIQIGGSGYSLNPSGMVIGQYVSSMGYIQAPSGGRVEIWNGGTENVATFFNDKSTTFYGVVNLNAGGNIGDYTTNTTLTFQSVNNGTSRINFYDQNNTEGVYIKNIGTTHGGDLRFGARWDDDEDKVFFSLRQSSAGASYDARFGLNVDPTETFHVSSNGITASAPSKGWPVYDAELDTNARRFIFQTAGNGGVGTAGQGASAALILGQYFDSRVIITTPGAGSSSPSDQGQGRGRDMMIKAGAADNTVGYVGGRLYLNGGIGYGAGGFNANGGHIIMQGLTGSGNVGINDTNPQTKLSINGANYIEMATFAITSSSSTEIVANNTGALDFTTRHNTNSSVFSITTGGIQILKAGIVHVSFSQDIRTAGTTGYVAMYIRKNGSAISENLITNTNTEWDMITGVVTTTVSTNDIISFFITPGVDILAIDPNTWSQYSFIWASR